MANKLKAAKPVKQLFTGELRTTVQVGCKALRTQHAYPTEMIRKLLFLLTSNARKNHIAPQNTNSGHCNLLTPIPKAGLPGPSKSNGTGTLPQRTPGWGKVYPEKLAI